ncbi:MAG TPA: glutamate decarboxylase [Solirubrobacter sp.]|nr:glutamate decarboxylase [Solirubrobacter sp.]
MPLHTARGADHDLVEVRPQYALEDDLTLPSMRLADDSVDPRVAYQVVADDLMLDGNARLNLATFVTTWMEPEARVLIAESLDKNIVDKDEYPRSAELERRCVNILADLWHAPPAEAATGCSTTGSSEACMLGGLALQRRWRARRTAAGQAADRPNLVFGTNVQVCWEKFCRYWDVEPRAVPVGDGATHLTAERAAAACDERTIGVVAILGSTFDGSYEPVAEIAAALDRLQAERGLDVPIHVDGASGGFVAPFLDPELVWDFRVDRVQSINASGHKFGLVYPGVGWVVWRSADALPAELVFHVDYLGGDMPTFALNFSRPGAQVIAQYFNFIRLGRDGYRRVHQACRDTAQALARDIAGLGPFALLSDGGELPVFAFQLTGSRYSVYDVSAGLREHGWLVPAYPMPQGMEDVHVLRVVIRNGFSRDLAGLLMDDLKRVCERLERHGGLLGEDATPGFHH